MARVRRLLTYPLRVFSFYAFLVLLISIPIYHWVLNDLWIEELDEQHAGIVQRVKSNLIKVSGDTAVFHQVIDYTTLLDADVTIQQLKKANVTYPGVETVHEKEVGDDREMERFRVYSDTLNSNGEVYEIRVATNVESEEEIITTISLITGIFFLVLILGFIFINFIISKKVWKPFEHILHALGTFKLTKGTVPQLERTRIREFNELQERVELLMRSSLASFEQQKQFLENASHELQTPIAILLSKVEQLSQMELNEEQHQKLGELEHALIRLRKLNRSMLLIAQLEQQEINKEQAVDLVAELRTTIESLNDFIDAKHLSIQFEPAIQPVYLEADSFQLETLLFNLLTNAIKYSREGSRIEIRLTQNELIIENPGDQSLNPDEVFERFSVNSKKNGNIGLGLAITKVICDRNKWKIGYSFEAGMHIFSIQFI